MKLSNVRDMLEHRGPDEAGIYQDDLCSLGHRRLDIIDHELVEEVFQLPPHFKISGWRNQVIIRRRQRFIRRIHRSPHALPGTCPVLPSEPRPSTGKQRRHRSVGVAKAVT